MNEEDLAIGLDLGTTFSCIGAYLNDKVEIIKNKRGENTTPSIVIINNDSSILVGEDTIDYLVQNYNTCIYEIKRLIGRKYSDHEIKKEIEKLPFKITHLKDDDSPMIEINIHGIPITYNPVEISSFIIKKMVQSAEMYLNKKVTKLVITVPAYFSDSQRKLTKQAAELVGLKVLRVLNEPTAAALAYGFDKNQKINEKILVFDLGGGTFDVSILHVKQDENNKDYKVFQVLGTSGDMQLGGEDFDNQLVDYFLNKRYNNNEEIKKDKKCIKNLKISCENVKKALSFAEKAILRINDFYNKEDLIEEITRVEFEEICQNLFKKLEIPLEDALSNAKLTKNDIKEVILIGGSTRIPKVKEIVKNYFPKSKINDSINPDEAVAFGATIEAEKILHNKNDSISNFLLMDITPLSLGTNIKNNSEDEKIREEGDVMSVIIKRGSHIPITVSQTYYSVSDNQKSMPIDIYEGERNFVKYNNLLKKRNIEGLKERPKGKTKVTVTLDIDIHGILDVTAKEESEDGDGKLLNFKIINDEMDLSNKMEELKAKNQEMLDKIRDNDLSLNIDYNNIKDVLKQYKDAYEKCKNSAQTKDKKDDDDDDEDEEEEEDDKILIYKTNFNNTLEEFINSIKLDNNLVNETMLEKYYLYVKELIVSYIETLKIDFDKDITKKIKEYVNQFIDKSFDYLDNLLNVLYIYLIEVEKNDNKKKKKLTKKQKKSKDKYKVLFYGIVIFVMEKLNEYGIKYIESDKKFCKYHSLIMFEKSNSYYEKYLSDIDKELLPHKEKFNFEKQIIICKDYIKDINSGAIALCLESFKGGYLFGIPIISAGRGITNDLKRFNLGNLTKEIERHNLVLSNYEKILSSIQSSDEQNKNTRKEAICLANIIKINSILGRENRLKRPLFLKAERCKFIVDHDKNKEEFQKEQWYKEFCTLYKKLSDMQPKDEEYYQIFPKIREKYESIFNEIDKQFNQKKKNIDFINFILKTHPYKDYEKDKDKRNFTDYNLDLVNFLLEKYQPDNYTLSGEENKQLEYCIVHEISKKLSNLYKKV